MNATRALRSSTQKFLYLSTDFGRRAFSYSSPATLNSIPTSIKCTRGWITGIYGNAVLAGLIMPTYFAVFCRYILNASARLIYRLGFRDHITDAFISLHWLRVRERIEFKLATLTYKLLHNQAASYLGPLVRVADVPGCRSLRSANTDCLVVPHVRLSSVGNRALRVAASRVWNSLPHEVTSAQSLYSFRRQLKTFLFQRSFPDVIVTL